MSQQQDQLQPEDSESGPTAGDAQHEHPQTEGHGGQGADSAMKQMRVWEQRRSSNSGGQRNQHSN